MAIIRKAYSAEPYRYGEPYSWELPNHFAPDSEKRTDEYWKKTMDYYYDQAIAQYNAKAERITRNYQLLKGFIKPDDFMRDERVNIPSEANSLIDTLERDMDLPRYVKHYPILNPPINELVGEMSGRPDNAQVKDFSDNGRSERQRALSQAYERYLHQNVQQMILEQNPNIEMEQVDEITEEELSKIRTSYSTAAERWGAKVLDALKVAFNTKELTEEAFRDLLICSTPFYHVITDNSKIGFKVIVENPKNVWGLKVTNRPYSRDWYAAGTIQVMELSEIIATYPFLTQEEIKHLSEQALTDNGVGWASSPSRRDFPTTPGVNSIKYEVYDPLIMQERLAAEARMSMGLLDEHMGHYTSSTWLGHFTVVKAYWQSKKKMGKLTYSTPQGPVTVLVDENYKKIPEEIEIEWGYINQWYEGLRIGDDIYYVNPYELLNYCPIIGVEHESKNTPMASAVDLAKPYQMLFNVCMNQLWHLLEIEQGRVLIMPWRDIPTSKDGDDQDAIDLWMLEAKEKGVVFIDDSPENRKSPSGFNQYSVHDWTRSQEMQTRLNMAEAIKMECWELLGLTRQRLGQTTSSETATAVNTALTQSYTQTEHYFVQQEYLNNQLYQAMLDAAVYVTLNDPESTLHLITDNSWLEMAGSEMTLPDLVVYVTSRAQDKKIFNELRQLSGQLLQSGADMETIVEMYTTTNTGQFRETVKSFQRKKDQLEQQASQQKQQELDQQQQQFEATMAQQEQIRKETMENDNMNKEADRINKREVALIQQMGKDEKGSYGDESMTEHQAATNELSRVKQQNAELQGRTKAEQDKYRDMMDDAFKQANLDLQRDKMAMQERMHKEDLAVQKQKAKAPKKKK